MAQESTRAAKTGTVGDTPDTHDTRDEFASKLVGRFSVWAGAAGLIPLPLVDVVTVAGVQLQMLRRLSEIYDVPFTENRGKSVIASLAGSMIPASSSLGAASALKMIPIIGMGVSAFMMPTLSAGATYLIGKVFIQHFRSGGTLLDFHAPDYRELIEDHKEAWSSPFHGDPGPRRDRLRATRRHGALARHFTQWPVPRGGPLLRGRERERVRMVEAIFYLTFCFLTGLCGVYRRMGFFGTFIISIFVTPVVVLLVLLLTAPSQRATWHRRAQ